MRSAKSFAEKSFELLRKVLHKHHEYEPWKKDGDIHLRPFQEEVVSETLSLLKKQDVVSIEVFCAGGKTIIGAHVSESFLRDGKKIVFISPKRDAFPHFAREFERVLATKGMENIRVHACIDPASENFPVDKQVFIVAPYDIVSDRSGGARRVIDEALKRSGLIIVDEVHRMPEDTEEDTKIIGRVEPIIREKAVGNGARVLTMTGTHFRSDDKDPFGRPEPDIRRTCQDLILARCLPQLYGYAVTIELDLLPGEIDKGAEVIQLRMARRKLAKYLGKVSDIVEQAIRLEDEFCLSLPRRPRAPGGHAIFVGRQEEAIETCRILNERLGREAFIPYVSDEVESREREEIQERLKYGDLLGYATVMMGVESINIPRLKYCHLVARITSPGKLMQAVGRVMRLPDQGDADCAMVKDKAVVIDYQIRKKKIISLAKGIRDIAKIGYSKIPQDKISLVGGPVFVSPGNGDLSDFDAKLAREYEAWLVAGNEKATVEEKAAWCLSIPPGAPRPKSVDKIKWTGLDYQGKPLEPWIKRLRELRKSS